MDLAYLWFWIVGFLFVGYFVLDGFDFGVGMLHFGLGKTPAERDTLLRSIGPVWDGNEVWLVAAGGTLFSLLGFMGLYAMLSLLFFLLVTRLLQRGLTTGHA